jgi:predicted TIM-barrel fold metal-dependent hydrolase
MATSSQLTAAAAAPAAATGTRSPSQFFDSHFHWWDQEKRPNPVTRGCIKHFGPEQYIAEMSASCAKANIPAFRGGVVVESTVSLMKGLPDAPLSAVEESAAIAEWIANVKVSHKDLQFRFVAFADMSDTSDNFEAILNKHRSILGDSLTGVRMILNYDAADASKCWPGVTSDALCSPTFCANFARLAEHNLSFDLQCNPTQLALAAELCRASPAVKVCLDHIGLPKLDPYLHLHTTHAINGDSTRVLNDAGVQALSIWKVGISALADAGPQVHVKLSMVGYVLNKWWTTEAVETGRHALLCDVVAHVVSVFGVERCMVGSNWPVDDEPKAEHMTLLNSLLEPLGLSDEETDMIWSKNAMAFYL